MPDLARGRFSRRKPECDDISRSNVRDRESVQESGSLLIQLNRISGRARNLDQILFFILFAMGFLPTLLTNDTIAIIGTPFMLYYIGSMKCREYPDLHVGG